MTDGSTGEKIKDKLMGTKDKVKETVGMGGGSEGAKNEEGGELGPGAATKLEDEVAKTSSDSPTKRVEGSGKALGKEESTE